MQFKKARNNKGLVNIQGQKMLKANSHIAYAWIKNFAITTNTVLQSWNCMAIKWRLNLVVKMDKWWDEKGWMNAFQIYIYIKEWMHLFDIRCTTNLTLYMKVGWDSSIVEQRPFSFQSKVLQVQWQET